MAQCLLPVMDNVSHVKCHVSHVTCHMSGVFLFCCLNGGASRWRVCYQRAYPVWFMKYIYIYRLMLSLNSIVCVYSKIGGIKKTLYQVFFDSSCCSFKTHLSKHSSQKLEVVSCVRGEKLLSLMFSQLFRTLFSHKQKIRLLQGNIGRIQWEIAIQSVS